MYQAIVLNKNTLILLEKLFEQSSLSKFTLAGGTGLAIQCGHRISIDLDFFCQENFNSTDLLIALESQFELADTITGPNSISTVIKSSKTMVKIDAIKDSGPLIDHIILEDGFRLYGLKDIAAMKLNAIANRGSKKDFYDLLELSKYFNLSEMISFFEEKYESNNSFAVIKSLLYFEDADLEVDPISIRPIKWDDVKKDIQEMVSQL